MTIEELKALGLSCNRPRKVRHRKLSAKALELFEREADLILSLTPYKTLAEKSGLALGSVQQIMAQLIREKRQHLMIVHRGIQLLDADFSVASAMIHETRENP